MDNKAKNPPVAGFILGVISIFTAWIPLVNFILPILAIVFSSRERKVSPNGMAIAGLVLGIIGLLMAIFWTIYFIFIFAIFGLAIHDILSNVTNATIAA